MNVHEIYVEGLKKCDPDMIASIFADDAIMDDKSGAPFGFPPIYHKNKEEIRKSFEGFTDGSYDMSASSLDRDNPNSFEYTVVMNDMVIPCTACMAVNEDGLVTEFITRPR